MPSTGTTSPCRTSSRSPGSIASRATSSSLPSRYRIGGARHAGEQRGHLATGAPLGKALQILPARIHQRDDDGGEVFGEDERGEHRERGDDIQPDIAAAQADDDLDQQDEQDRDRGENPDAARPVTPSGKLRDDTGKEARRRQCDDERPENFLKFPHEMVTLLPCAFAHDVSASQACQCRRVKEPVRANSGHLRCIERSAPSDEHVSPREPVRAKIDRPCGCQSAAAVGRPPDPAQSARRRLRGPDRAGQSALSRNRRHPQRRERGGALGSRRRGDRGGPAARGARHRCGGGGERMRGPGSSSRPVSATAAARSPNSPAGGTRKGLRLVGPNCLGVLAPRRQAQCQLRRRMPRGGRSRADLAVRRDRRRDWSNGRRKRAVGFSGVVSLGDQIDVDFGDLLDYFALDRATRAILLYVESIKDARKFMSAARAAARVKPVVVVKSGRHAQGARAAATHTGALAGSDAVYDAAFRRAGLLRVLDLDELFAAAETLGRLQPFSGKRLAILTNGGGIGVLAVDRLARSRRHAGGPLARDDGSGSMPRCRRSGRGPIRSTSSAMPMRRATPTALEALLADAAQRRGPGDERADGARVVGRCGADRSSSIVQQASRRAGIRRSRCFAVWVGRRAAADEPSKPPAFRSYRDREPMRCAGSCISCATAKRLRALMETPPSLPEDFAPDVAAARRIVDGACARSAATWLDPVEITRLLAAYAIPIAPALLARDADEAAAVAAPLLAEGGDRCRQDSLARHRAQVRCRRRAAQPRPAKARCAKRRARHSGAGARCEARGPHRRRHRPSDDPAAEGARTDRRHRRRSDLRSGHRVRARRHGGRGHRRQGAGAAAARPQDGARADCAHARCARAQGLSRRAGGRRERDRAGAGEAGAACRRPAGDPRTRSQSAARRRARASSRSMRASRSRRSMRTGRGSAWASALCHPALSEGMGAARHAAGRHGRLCAAGAAGGRAAVRAVLRRASATRICGCASSRRSRNSATPSSRA